VFKDAVLSKKERKKIAAVVSTSARTLRKNLCGPELDDKHAAFARRLCSRVFAANNDAPALVYARADTAAKFLDVLLKGVEAAASEELNAMDG
jgi:hypothetical protein